uniref:DUF3615 domain-containing protein n=1 Tax=Oryza brachyantha TaxID=4533 RepID=J3LUN6_ORYBR
MGALVSRAVAAVLGDHASDEAGELRRWMEEDAKRQAMEEEEEQFLRHHPDDDTLPFYLRNRPLPSEEERDGYFIWEAQAALQQYNAIHPGVEYDLVKPLMGACVFFRGNMRYHVSFLAQRRGGQVAPPVEYFFAELCDGCSDDEFIVDACTMIEDPQSCSGNRCSFCPGNYGIAHPCEQELLCGEEEHAKEFIRLMNMAPAPFTCPTETVAPPDVEIVIEH